MKYNQFAVGSRMSNEGALRLVILAITSLFSFIKHPQCTKNLHIDEIRVREKLHNQFEAVNDPQRDEDIQFFYGTYF